MVYGIGTHIVECLRIAQMIERHADLFLNRVFNAAEIRYCQSRKQATQHFAAHWAGKEAVLKALGTPWRRDIAWRDIEICVESGAPFVKLSGGARQAAEEYGVNGILLSLSHCRTHATAYAMTIGLEVDD